MTEQLEKQLCREQKKTKKLEERLIQLAKDKVQLQKKLELEPLQQLCNAHEQSIESMEMEFGKLESLFLLVLGSTDYKTDDGKYDIQKLS